MEDQTKVIPIAQRVCPLVKGTQEATLDSAFLVMASNISALKARSMKTTAGTFDVGDFIEKLISFMGGNQTAGEPIEEGVDVDDTVPLKWEKIGRKALAKSRRVPAMDFMYVSFMWKADASR